MSTDRAVEADPTTVDTALLTPARLTRFGLATAFAMAFSVVVVVVTADGIDTLAGLSLIHI